MRIRNGDTPIQLPEIVRVGDPITARWANGLRAAVQRLRDRTPVISGSRQGVPPHPFKIIVELTDDQLRLYVNYGQVLQSVLRSWIDYPLTNDCDSQQQEVTIGGGNLLNHPDGRTAAYIALSASTTYGIWIKGTYSTLGTSSNYFNSTTEGYGYVRIDRYTAFFSDVIAESDYTTPDSKPDNGEIWLFLGSVEVDAGLNATIVQWWKSDLLCPAFNMPRIEASSDDGNSLFIGTDGKLYSPPIVSANAGNDIIQGTDLGAFYEAPAPPP